MERDCESELSKLNIEQNACIYHFGASVIHGQRSNILRLRWLGQPALKGQKQLIIRIIVLQKIFPAANGSVPNPVGVQSIFS